LPYSFNACKRGVRYHIHVNWYGDLVQVDELGSCGGDDRYYRGRSYDDEYRRGRYENPGDARSRCWLVVGAPVGDERPLGSSLAHGFVGFFHVLDASVRIVFLHGGL
jgi:hypothetical protein